MLATRQTEEGDQGTLVSGPRQRAAASQRFIVGMSEDPKERSPAESVPAHETVPASSRGVSGPSGETSRADRRR
jgi:hypothetical protein